VSIQNKLTSIIAVIAFSCSIVPWPVLAVGAPKKHIRIAVLPYTSSISTDINKKVRTIEKQLKRQKNISILPYRASKQIAQYYLDYVDAHSRGTELSKLIRDARKAYSEFDYKLSNKILENAEALINNRIADGKSNERLIDIYILKSKLAYVDGRKSDAVSLYTDIARLNPTLEHDKRLYSRWEIKALLAAKKHAVKEKHGMLSIQAKPHSSEVYVNGVHYGLTLYNKPLTIGRLLPGNHCLEIKTVNHEPYIQYIDVEPGKTHELTISLSRLSRTTKQQFTGIPPDRFQTPEEMARLMMHLGYYLKVDKLVLIYPGDASKKLTYQIGDVGLGAVNIPSEISLAKKNKEPLKLVTREMQKEIRKDVLSQSGDQLISKNVGSMLLHERRKKPIYKKPLFWILVGAGAAAGGVAGILLGGSSAAASTGGVIIAF